ncbi:zinc D-Ala-D-Ala carboxypeptidase [Nocardioides daedukensis]|uniref:Zinc D-Ala-D-Ala carboxypeptidase n=1 Tax=Nocardioides daedukensis TaxID=634462 RepID=A0A7Y9UNX3_9ACTN|nr:D-Ala-D-Ala carboxypeptidase family metallohydrolase [Nocardioides daedukensis]NYG57612.1 zinc D-Ala-D-Ala carboxypeptidase [Nocardioides daedukensis]
MRRRLSTLLAAIALAMTGLVVLSSTTPANADACYTWSRTLKAGATGADVSQLQIRVAGWAGYRTNMAVDGSYGPQTTTAVKNFQAAYGLSADGVAGPDTFTKLYGLQKDDCSPAHFSWTEVDGGCGVGGYSGGSVSSSTVKANLLRAMWRAEALRHRMGDIPLRVTSGFRSQSCDRSVGGSGTGQHTYGRAIDVVPVNGNTTLCRIAQAARYVSFGTLLGPGYPDHNDHVHVDIRPDRIFWSAPSCGI